MVVLIVIAPKDFRDDELFDPLQVFYNENITAQMVSTTVGEHIGMLGGKATTKRTINDVNVDDFDAIMIVGGIGSKKYLWNNEDLIDLVKKFYKKGKIVSAICLSPVILAKAGILKGKKATVYPVKEAMDILKENGAEYVDEGVVTDGNIITAKDPEFTIVFGNKIAEMLEK